MEEQTSNSKGKWIMAVSNGFQSHGRFCASHPWEVIIGTITILTIAVSMSVVAVDKVCGWNYQCPNLEDVKSSDIIILTVTRCIAVIYIYLQFRKLRKLGSKYLLGIAGVFTVFSSFVFSIAIMNVIGSDLTGLSEALPFFLLLVDLSNACSLAQIALNSKNQDEVATNIGHGMSILGPTITLDTIVETLVVGIGTLSGVRTLETMCCFGCLTVVINYIGFMTFYPACLALIYELLENKGKHHYLNMQQIKTLLTETEKEKKSNPVAQRIKLIMSAGLMIFHTHSRMISESDNQMELSASLSLGGTTPYMNPDAPIWQFYLEKLLSPGIDYHISTLLAIFLIVKYIFYDDDTDEKTEKMAKDQFVNESNDESSQICHNSESNDKSSQIGSNNVPAVTKDDIDNTVNSVACDTSQGEPQHRRSVHFCISDSSDEDDEGDQCKTDALTKSRPECTSVSTQTIELQQGEQFKQIKLEQHSKELVSRSLEECAAALKSDVGPSQLSDNEIMLLVKHRLIPAYKLEAMLGDHERGVHIRRQIIGKMLTCDSALNQLPYTNYDYKHVEGACCENVVGYIPVPVGIAGPLLLDGQKYQVPMATTEGCLVASTNRGCKLLTSSGGVKSTVIGNGMTRAPVVRFQSALRASEIKAWLEELPNFNQVKVVFDSTSRFARLKRLHIVQAARNLYIRFVAVTGDAMGMNMLSKGSEKVLNMLTEKYFPDMEILGLSGNFCTDKKPSAVNWIEGRGKSVVCEAIIPNSVIKSVLKTSVSLLVDLNINKNYIGSAMAGSIGGFNAQAANIVTAIYIATGQDPAQNVSSSNCITVMEATGEQGEDLYISCTMPSVEVGTVGGGTVLPPQSSCLEILGVKGSNHDNPGENAVRLARIICGTVMAGEVSLMAALAEGQLVRSHLRHNRSSVNMAENKSTLLTQQSATKTITSQDNFKNSSNNAGCSIILSGKKLKVDIQPSCKLV